MKTLIGLVILVLDIIAILDCVKSSLDKTKKIIWIVVIIVFPLIGLVLYYVIGKKQIPSETPGQ